MLEHSVVAICTTQGKAEAAVQALRHRHFPIKNVSIVAGHLEDKRSIHGFAMACDTAKPAAVTGLWLGGLVGVFLGAAIVSIPGFGPLVVAGSLASFLLGAFEGTAGGAAVLGMLGFLVGLGISKEMIGKYEGALKAGKFLVIAHGSTQQVSQAQEILADLDAEDIDVQ